MATARAGKRVYCEKPMGLNLQEAREIAAAITTAKVASTVGFSVRFDPIFHTMVRLARGGELGRILSICARRLGCFDPAKGPAWRRDHRKSGGLLLEINIHEIDWMMAAAAKLNRSAPAPGPPNPSRRGSMTSCSSHWVLPKAPPACTRAAGFHRSPATTEACREPKPA